MKKFCLIFLLACAYSPGWAQYAYLSQFGSAGTDLEQFSSPQGIAISSSGYIYVTDGGNNRIQRFGDPFTIQWGTSVTPGLPPGTQPAGGQFASPRGIAIDPANGDVYVTDEGNYRIQKFTADGAFITTWGGEYSSAPGKFEYAYAIAVDDNVYVADHTLGRVQKFAKNGTFLSVLISGFNQPRALVVRSGVLYVLNTTGAVSKQVTMVNTSTGLNLGSWPVNNSSAEGLGIDATGNIYVVCTNEVKKFTTTGTLIPPSIGSSGAGSLTGGRAVAVDGLNNIQVVEVSANVVKKFSPVPVMAVFRSAVSINNGSTYDLGDEARFTTDHITLTVKNDGMAGTTLSLIGSPAVSITGPHAADFAVNTSALATSIAGSQSGNFEFTFSPGALGLRTATFSIPNNDPSKNPYTFTVTATGVKNSQAIDFNPPSSLPYGTTVDLGATSSSGLPVSYLVVSGPGTINGTELTVDGTGTIDVKALQEGNIDYVAAFPVTRSITGVKANQTITFNALTDKTFGDASFSPGATASSGLTVNYSSSNTAVATVSGAIVTIVGAGTTTITASQAGNANYNAASGVGQTLTVNKKTPSLSITSAASGNFLGTINLVTNTDGSTGDLTYSVTNSFNGTAGSAIVDNIGDVLTLTTAGQVRLTATLAAASNFNGASATQVITINKLTPTVSITSATSGTYGGTVHLAANKGGSSGTVTFSVTNGTGSAQITDNVLSLTGAGSVSLRADVAADANYNAAFVSNFVFTIEKANPVLDVLVEGNPTYGNPPLLLTPIAGGSTGTQQLSLSFSEGGNGNLVTDGSGTKYLHMTHAGTINVEFSVAADANYNAGHVSNPLWIEPRPATISGLVAADMVYNGNTGTTVSGVPVLENILPSDQANVTLVSGDVAANFDNPNAGTSKVVTITGFSLSGSAASENYVLTMPTITSTIHKRHLPVTGISTVDRIYNGTTEAVVAGTPSLDNQEIVEGETLSLEGEGAANFGSKNAGTHYILFSGYSLNGPTAANYELTFPMVFANITPRSLGVSGLVAADKIYDGTNTASITGIPMLESGVPDDMVEIAGTATASFADKNAGTNKVVAITGYSLSGADAGNYQLSEITTAASISPKPLNIGGLTAQNKEYDGDVDATLSGIPVLHGVLDGDLVSIGGDGVGIFENENAGIAKVVSVSGLSLSGPQSGNYELNNVLHATITPKALEVVAIAVENKVYDGTTVGSVLGSPLIAGGVIGGDVVVVTGSGVATFASKNVGTDVIATVGGYSLSGADAGNYSLIPSSLLANITPRPLTVTAHAMNKVYGDPDPDFTFTSSVELFGGDSFTGSLSRTSGENAGTYSIALGSLTAGDNYSIAFTGAHLIIAKASLTAVADDVTSRAGEPLPVMTISYQGFKNGDTKNAITEPSVSTTATASSPRGTYPIHLTGGNGGSNYQLVLVGGTLTIRPPLATIQITGTSYVYDGAPKFVNVATQPQGIGVSITYQLNGADVSSPTNAGTYIVTVTITDPEYEGTMNGTLTIGKANQVITFAAIEDKTLGDAPFTLSAQSSASLPVTFLVSSPEKISMSGSLVTLVAAGRASVAAIQPGNANYSAAPVIDHSFCIRPPKPLISMSMTNADVPVLTSSNASGNQWYLGGSPLTGAVGESITVAQGGTYTVRTSADDCSSEFSSDFPLIVTGISAAANEVQAYPNPAGDFLTVNGAPGVKNILVQNTAGVEQKVDAKDHNGSLVVNVASLPAGNYLLRLQSSEANTVIRFIKK